METKLAENIRSFRKKRSLTQEQLAEVRASGSSGGNMVTVTLNGKFEMVDLVLDPICVDNRDVPMLQDLIKAAHHAAVENVQEEIKAKLGPMLSGMNIPGLG